MGDGRIDLPIACSLEGPALEARTDDWARLLATSTGKRPITGGIRVNLDPTWRDRLLELIERESECCPWMSVTFTEGPTLALSITSGDPMGERQILDWFS